MKVLVVGAGIGGMSAAIALKQIGADVEVVEIDPEWRVSGAGITITGPTLRALQRLGVYEEIKQKGYVGDGIRVCDVNGEYLHDLPTPRTPDADVEGRGGILRPVLHKILSSHMLNKQATVHLGVSVENLVQDADGVDISFSDGTQSRYDLVVGADGISSRTRQQIFPDAPQVAYTGQSVWRILTDRPVSIETSYYFVGGQVMVGFTPVSDHQMYLFLVESTEQVYREPDELFDMFTKLLAPYGGVVADIRDKVTPDTDIVFRPLEAFHLLAPWHVGRVVLVGDAAHPTTPQLSSGAGIACEDAIVLAEELQRADSVSEALDRFLARRETRCRLVVESSIRIGELEQAGAPPQERTAVVDYALAKLTEPI